MDLRLDLRLALPERARLQLTAGCPEPIENMTPERVARREVRVIEVVGGRAVHSELLHHAT